MSRNVSYRMLVSAYTNFWLVKIILKSLKREFLLIPGIYNIARPVSPKLYYRVFTSFAEVPKTNGVNVNFVNLEKSLVHRMINFLEKSVINLI